MSNNPASRKWLVPVIVIGVATAAGVAFNVKRSKPAPQPEATSAPVARRSMLQITEGCRRLLRRGRFLGRGRHGAPSFGEPHTVGAILDQTQHFETQALGRR